MKQLSTNLASHRVVIYNRNNELEKEIIICGDEARKILSQKTNKETVIVRGSTYEHWQVQISLLDELDQMRLREGEKIYIQEIYLCQSLQNRGIYLQKRIAFKDGNERELDHYFIGYKNGKKYKILDKSGRLEEIYKKI